MPSVHSNQCGSRIFMAISLLGAFLVLCSVGGAYALVVNSVLQRFGRAHLVALWLATSAGLGALGSLRSLALQRAAEMDVARVSVPGFYSMFIVAMLLVLSVPTAALARKASRIDSHASTSRRFLSGVGSTIGGIVLALAVALVLDLANVPFVPIR